MAADHNDRELEELLRQIEAEKQKAAILSSSQPQTSTFTVARENVKSDAENALAIGLQSLHDKTTGQVDPDAPSTWVPARKLSFWTFWRNAS